MADPLAWIDDEAARWERRGLTRRLVAQGAATPGRLACDGRTLVNFGANDYLGLASDPRVIAAGRAAAEAYGWGAGASPLVTGWGAAHQELAEALARFERAEAAVLFPSGFAANLGTIAALVGVGDAVYVDRLDHACLIDGARLSGASLRVFPHADADRLEEILARERARFRRVLVATDGVFSMDGDLAPAGSPGRSGRPVRRHAPGRRGARHGRLRPRRPGRGLRAAASPTGSRSGSARSRRRSARSAGSSRARGG